MPDCVSVGFRRIVTKDRISDVALIGLQKHTNDTPVSARGRCGGIVRWMDTG